jgi:alpha-mannosidase
MVYEDAERLYAEVRTDTEALMDNTMRVLYPGSLSLSSVASAATSTHNTTSFSRREIVRVPLTSGGISSGDVLQTTSDGEEGYIVLEGGAGGGLALPSQISIKNLHSEQRSYVSLVTVVY